jgi:hypothetical protein
MIGHNLTDLKAPSFPLQRTAFQKQEAVTEAEGIKVRYEKELPDNDGLCGRPKNGESRQT